MAQIHWLNDVSGSFTNPGEWSGGRVPGAADDAILDAAGVTPYTVGVLTDVTVSGVQTAVNATLAISGGTFTATSGTDGGINAGTINIGAATLTTSGTFDNEGVINLGGTSQKGASLVVEQDGTLVMTGGGVVNLGTASPNGILNSRLYAAGPSGEIVNADNTIEGGGTIQAATIVNMTQGVLEANIGVYPSLVLDAATIINSGTLEAGAGNLRLQGVIYNQNGVIREQGVGSAVFLGDHTTIVGGLIADAFVSASDLTLDGRGSGIELNVDLQVGGPSLTLEGDVLNRGSIIVQSGDAIGTVEVVGQTTLDGGGYISLISSHSYISGAAGSTLTLIDQTISGRGVLGKGELNVINGAGGLIETEILDVQGRTLSNAGRIESRQIIQSVLDDTAGGIVEAASYNISLQGAVIRGGTVETAAGKLVLASSGYNVLDGSSGQLTNSGLINVAAGGELTLMGVIANSGSLSLVGGTSSTLTIAAMGASLSGGGKLFLGDGTNHIVEGADASATLTNVDNLISGAGLLGDGRLALVNEAAGRIESTLARGLVIDTGATAISNSGLIAAVARGVVTVTSAIVNNGRLEAYGGTLTVTGAVSGTGLGVISGGVLGFEGAFDERAQFLRGRGTLRLAQSQSYTGAVFNFATNGQTALDLGDIGFVGAGEASYSGTAAKGVLTVSDGTHTAQIHLVGDYLSAVFTAASDGHGGVVVTASAGQATFVAAAASLGGGSSETRLVSPPPCHISPVLALPLA